MHRSIRFLSIVPRLRVPPQSRHFYPQALSVNINTKLPVATPPCRTLFSYQEPASDFELPSLLDFTNCTDYLKSVITNAPSVDSLESKWGTILEEITNTLPVEDPAVVAQRWVRKKDASPNSLQRESD